MIFVGYRLPYVIFFCARISEEAIHHIWLGKGERFDGFCEGSVEAKFLAPNFKIMKIKNRVKIHQNGVTSHQNRQKSLQNRIEIVQVAQNCFCNKLGYLLTESV